MMPLNHPDRLFPVDKYTRDIARALYLDIKDAPIISPHGHCDPSWFAKNELFPDPTELFIIPDHYVLRMLISQGIHIENLGIADKNGIRNEKSSREIWNSFADNYHLFRATPSQMWLDHSFEHVFGLTEPLNAKTANHYYDHISNCLTQEAFRPRALFDQFNIEALATTESALDPLEHHKYITQSDWNGRIITTYRPDNVIDPEFEGFHDNLMMLGQLTGEDTTSWNGYLAAHRKRRAFFKEYGATATDHGHPTARTENLTLLDIEHLFQIIVSGKATAHESEIFRGHMLTEMAKMSLDDGLVLQIHPGSHRNHSKNIFDKFGRDKGFDIPTQTNYVDALKPLLNAVGMESQLTIIIFTLDETAYSRELAPLAGVYPALRLGPPWWFFDSPEGIKRFRETTTETCGFYNTVGFNDDTRAFCSIPARHDVARRADCSYLAQLVTTGRLREDEAFELASDLAYGLAKSAYNL